MPIFVWPQLMRCAEYQFYLLCVCAVLGRMKNHFNQLDLCSILLSHCLLITFLSALWIFMCVYKHSSTLPIPLTPSNFIYYRVYWVEWAVHEPFLLYWMSKREKERGNKLHSSPKRYMGSADAFTQKTFSSVSWMSKKKHFLNGPLFHHFGSFCWFSWVHALFQPDTKNHVLYPVHYTMLPLTIASFRRIEVICDKIIITQWLCWAADGKLVELSGSELMMVFDVHRRWAAPCWSIKCVHKAFGNKLNILI